MKKTKLLAAALAIMMCMCLGVMAADSEDKKAGEDIAVRLDDEKILVSEFEKAFQSALGMMQQQRRGNIPPEQIGGFRKMVLQDLIKNKVAIILAKKEGIKVPAEDIDAEITKIKATFPSEETFDGMLKQQGLSVDFLRNAIKDNLTVVRFSESKTTGVKVTEEEIKEKYEEFKGLGYLDKPESADVAHILAKVDTGADEEAWSAAKEKIDAARKRVQAGEDFKKVLSEVSDDPGGGVYPNTPRDQMVAEFEYQMFSVEIGEVSEPFKTKFGWHILTVSARSEGGVMALEEVAEDIEKGVTMDKKTKIMDELVEAAKADINIEILIDLPEDKKEEEHAHEASDPSQGSI